MLLRRWLRRLTRYPRLVSHADYMNLRYAWPGEQRKCSERLFANQRLALALMRRRVELRRQAEEKQSLARILKEVAPERYAAWTQEQRMKRETQG